MILGLYFKIGNFEMSFQLFEKLNLDVFQLIIACLPQKDLINLLLVCNRKIYQEVMKYIGKLPVVIPSNIIEAGKYFKNFGKMNMIISIELNTKLSEFTKQSKFYWSSILYGACKSGHTKLVNLSIKNGAVLGYGLDGACKGGHKALVLWFIHVNGENGFLSAMRKACKGGHQEIVELLIESAEHCTLERKFEMIDEGFEEACKNNNEMLIKCFIEKYEYYLNLALTYACGHGNKKFIEWLIKRGANHCCSCRRSMEAHLQK